MRRTPIEELLRRLPMFAAFDRNEIHRLDLVLHRRTWERGEVICARGTPGNALYIISQGEVSFRQSNLDHIHTGDFFNEAALFIDARHCFDAVAEKRSELLVLFRHDFEQFAKRSPAAAVSALFAFARLLAERNLEGNELAEGVD
jgi:CRP-like cAMP-binding protein